MESDSSQPTKYRVDAGQATGVAIGDRAKVIQHIGAIYHIHPSAEVGTRISASLKDRLERLLKRHILFGGREKELALLNGLLSQRASGYLFVTGRSGFGKTALLSNWVRTPQPDDRKVCYHFISRIDDVADESFSLLNLCQQLASYHGMIGSLPNNVAEMRSLYSLLLSLPPTEGEKLIIVLDALDEAVGWKAGPDLFPSPLPEGVFVVFSAREIAGQDWLSTLGLPRQEVEVLELKTLGIAEVANLLKASVSQVSKWAEDQSFIKALHQKSEGDPFYLRYLIEDIRDNAINSLGQLQQQPRGLKGYLDRWWQELSEATSEQSVRDLLSYLLVAKGRLTHYDLVNVSDQDALSGMAFDRTLRLVQRYLVGNESQGFALSHHRFQEYLSKERISAAEQAPYRQRLIDYCSRWQEHESAYPLLYYADHLLEQKRWEQLYEIARNAEFAEAQKKRFPAEPYLPLKNIQFALSGAAENDSAPEMVEFLLLHYQSYVQILRETPLEALREGQLQRAWLLADLHTSDYGLLWHLLLSLESKENGRTDEARLTLLRLSEKALPRLSGWKGQYGIELLWGVMDLADDVSIALMVKGFLDDESHELLAQRLADEGKMTLAIKSAALIQDRSTRGRQLISILESLGGTFQMEVSASEFDKAKATHSLSLEVLDALLDSRGNVFLAIKTARSIADQYSRREKLTAIAQVLKEAFELQRAAGDFLEAEATRRMALEVLTDVLGKERMEEMTDAHIRAEQAQGQVAPEAASPVSDEVREKVQKLLDDIENNQSEAEKERWRSDEELKQGALEKARKGQFSSAFEEAQGIQTDYTRWIAINDLAVSQAQAGDYEALRSNLESLGKEEDRERAWYTAALTYVQAGDIPAALLAAEKLDETEWWLVDALKHIAISQAKDQQFAAALENVKRMNRSWEDHHGALLSIALEQRQAGYQKNGRTTLALGLIPDTKGYEEILEPSQDELLAAIGRLQVMGGDYESAHDTARLIVESLQRGFVLREIAYARIKAGDLQKAVDIAAVMEKEWEQQWTLRSIAEEMANGGRFQDAVEITGRIPNAETEVESLCMIAGRQQKGDRQGALSTLNRALDVANKMLEAPKRVTALAKIAGAFKSSDVSRSEQIFRSARESADAITDEVYSRMALVDIAEALAKAGQFSDALALSAEIESRKSQEGGVLSVIAMEQTKASQFGEAIKTANRIHEEGYRVLVICSLVVEQAKLNPANGIEATLEDALAIASQIQDAEKRASALAQIAETQSKLGNKAKSLAILAMAKDSVVTIEDSRSQAFALEQIALTQARTAEFSSAFQTANGISVDYLRERVLAQIAELQAHAGKREDALVTFGAIHSSLLNELTGLARVFTEVQDKPGIKQLLIPAGRDRKAVLGLCELLGKLYTDQCLAMAGAITRFVN